MTGGERHDPPQLSVDAQVAEAWDEAKALAWAAGPIDRAQLATLYSRRALDRFDAHGPLDARGATLWDVAQELRENDRLLPWPEPEAPAAAGDRSCNTIGCRLGTPHEHDAPRARGIEAADGTPILRVVVDVAGHVTPWPDRWPVPRVGDTIITRHGRSGEVARVLWADGSTATPYDVVVTLGPLR